MVPHHNANNMQSIKTILEDMKTAIETQRTVSPTEYADWAMMLNVLWQDLKTELIKAEIKYIQDVAELMEEDDKLSKGKAEILVKAKKTDGWNSYGLYQYLKGRDKLIDEYIKLCKKRITLEQNYD